MICTIYAPWFGPLPWYKDVFLACCRRNPYILWVIHSDQESPENLAANILWIRCSCPWKHKLCDLKPWWHLAYPTDSMFRGWCDWDVVHDLSKLQWDFEAAKFTLGGMASPIFITHRDYALDYYPLGFMKMMDNPRTTAWEEIDYLRKIAATYLQNGLTPEIDLNYRVPFAVHMYKAKHFPELYKRWMLQYCDFPIGDLLCYLPNT